VPGARRHPVAAATSLSMACANWLVYSAW
jgi:hypothetical protein